MSDRNNSHRVFGSESYARTNNRRIERIHETWLAFIDYCSTLQHGEIERLKIQDGLPMLAEVIKEKIRFAR